MCGLVGIFSPKINNEINRQVTIMTSKLAHRGPDDEGVWCMGSIGLGHKRLSVLDLSSSGSQPMHSDCGRYVIVFNGEIYNHLVLRNRLELENAAPNWRGHSDTETLLAAIRNWGLDKTLHLLQGMFALAIWDQKKKILSLARDRIGEKPLYWGWAGKDLIFGSELKSLRAHPNCPKDVCKKALIQYLRFAYVPAPRSIYPGIYKLEPGCILTVKEAPPAKMPNNPVRPGNSYGSLSIRRYWDLSEEIIKGSKNIILDEKEAIYKTEQTLSQSVKNQMLSDVAIGAFLSGGVDSSTIVALMQKQSSRPIKTFTIGFDDSNYDESLNAAAVSKYLGTNHTKLDVTETDALKVIPDLPFFYDEPFSDSSQIPTQLVCRAAKQNVTVALSGDGGDEVFGGYNRYIHGPSLYKHISHVPKFFRKFLGKKFQDLSLNSWNRIGEIYNFIKKGSSGISNLGLKVNKVSEYLIKSDNFNEFYLNLVSSWNSPEEILVGHITEPTSQINEPIPDFMSKDLVMTMIFQDMRSYLPDDILCKVDRASMSVSLETRSPFLDKDVIELSTRLPTNMKIRGDQGKWALRKVLRKYVPDKIIDRPKEGFAIPIGSWLRGPLNEWAGDHLSKTQLSNNGLNTEIIQKRWTEHLAGSKDWTNSIWTILMFQAWMISQK